MAVDAYSLQQAANIDLSTQDELRDLQHWPWPRRHHGRVLTRLRGANNLVVPNDKLQQKEAKQPEEKSDDNGTAGEEPTPPQTTPAESLSYVCRASSGNLDLTYFTGRAFGGPLSEAIRFSTPSKSEASCAGKGAGSDGMEPTTAVFL